MKARDKKTNQQRRNFLRGSVAAGAGAALTAAAGVTVANTPDEQPEKAKGKKAGYQLSQHVLDYYKTCAR
jgi:hypothetical protein